MTLTVDFSTDYDTVYDFNEAVTLETVSTEGVAGRTITKAYRAQPSHKERAPTAGVYAGYDLTWILPGVLVGTTSVPVPGSRVLDSSGIRWTALTCDYDQMDRIWALFTVNLALANNLRDSVTLMAPSAVRDVTGSRLANLSAAHSNVLCRIQEQSAESVEERGKRMTIRRFNITLAERVYPSTTWVVIDADGNEYEVRGWSNPDRIDELMVLDCVLDPP